MVRHTEVEKGQRVLHNNPDADIPGTVVDYIDRKHTHVHSARYRFKVEWDTGAVEWLGAWELKPFIECICPVDPRGDVIRVMGCPKVHLGENT